MPSHLYSSSLPTHAASSSSFSCGHFARTGREGTGVVVTAPSDSSFNVGDRVACLTPGNSSYAQFVSVPTSNCVRVPDAVPLDTACAALLQGLTAIVLTRRVYPVAAGDTVLVHAAAGGTGSLILQACGAAGATGALSSLVFVVKRHTALDLLACICISFRVHRCFFFAFISAFQ